MLAIACLFSGCAALVYQLLWTRQVGHVLGNTVEAVATVVAAFMGGLATGNTLAASRADKRSRAALVRLYVSLECGIALLAGIVPLLLRGARPSLAALYGDGIPSPLLGLARVLVSAVALAPPTVLMGATLPVLVALSAPAAGNVGRSAGLLYAWNTVGAVLGSLGGALLLLPRLGVRGATLVSALLNAAAAVVVLLHGRHQAGPEPPAGPAAAESGKRAAVTTSRRRRARKAAREGRADAASLGERPLPLAMALGAGTLFGFAGLANEVAWTRALILLIGPTAYAFAYILTAVIAGLAVGSAAASLVLTRIRRPSLAIGGLLAVGALLGVAVVHVVANAVLPIGEFVHANTDDVDRLLRTQLLFVLALLGPPMAISGAAFPLLASAVAERVSGAARSVGLLLAWNTLGAILGSLAAGFLLLPALGLEKTLLLVVLLQAAGAAVVILGPARTAGRAGVAAAALVAVALALNARTPWDDELLSGGVYKYAAYAGQASVEDTIRAGTLLYYEEGRAATVSVKRLGGTTSVAVDGKVDATSSGDMLTQRLLAHLPLLLHPAPRSALVIGLGSGVTAGSALAHPLESVDAVEISEGVAYAARRFFSGPNRNALDDPRLRLILGDGRNHLQLTNRRYDVIISEPSNPWMVGVSGLFTRDFFVAARSRMNPGGLFCQWAHVYNMSEADLRTVIGSFGDAFPGAALFLVNEGDVLLIGGPPAGPSFDPDGVARRMRAERVQQDLDEVGVRSLFGFASLLTLPPKELLDYAEAADRHTDNRPVLEFRAPRAIHANTGRQNAERLIALGKTAAKPEPWARLTAAPTSEEWLERASMLERSEASAWAYAVYTQAAARGPTLAALEGLVRSALRAGRGSEAEASLRGLAKATPVEARTALGLLYDNQGRLEDALRELQAALEQAPRHRRALLLAAEIQEQLGNVDSMSALARQALAAAPSDPEAAAYLASASLASGDLDAAIAEAERVLARAPREARALQVGAIARAQKGDRAGARRLFERLIANEPDASGHLSNFGVFELEGRDYRAAARLFEAALDLDPSSATAQRGLAEAARALGEPRLLDRAARRPDPSP